MKAPDKRARNLALYEKLVATNPEIELKGDTMPYTSVNGHMFSLFTKEDQVTLRLPPEELDAFISKYKTKNSFQYGMIMKEYAVVPDALLEKTYELQKYFDISYSWVKSLKPKPTTKKKTGAKP